MKGTLASISGVYLPLLIHQATANIDFISLYTSGGVTIVEATATLILPAIPNPVTGDVALWSAIQLESDFIQGVTENAPAGLGYCYDLGNNWCNFAYALTPNAKAGKSIAAAPGAKVKTHCKQGLFISSPPHLLSNKPSFQVCDNV